MKITKRQLKRIIKEEKAKVIAENRLRRIVRRSLREATVKDKKGREHMGDEPFGSTDPADFIRYFKENPGKWRSGHPFFKELSANPGFPRYNDSKGRSYHPAEVFPGWESSDYKDVIQAMTSIEPGRTPTSDAGGGRLVKYGSLAELMSAVADYYRAEYGADADDFIQGATDIRELLFNDENIAEDMGNQDAGNLIYDPEANTVSAQGGRPEPIPGDLAKVAQGFYSQERFLPKFLHLITGTVPRSVAFLPDGYEIYDNM